ncbi:MAG: putative ABC transporter ATP-binding protein [Candidatus Heimdallarchaeota archaeon LC_2]|nr:MAG: putative ABC transporter ATP-binding protein [Candidatus Heimdallarchaeota archaeon LC_2]
MFIKNEYTVNDASLKSTNNEIHIKARKLVKHYKLGETTVKALDGVDLDIKRGEMVIIVGPSGSGKSTLLNMLGGVDRPDSGDVQINGTSLSSLNDKELTTFRRKFVGFVFQFYSLIPTLTAQENIEIAAELVDIKGADLRKRAQLILSEVGLIGRNTSYPSHLSGGERQRIALGRALAKRPELIIVDEPTGQLDKNTGIEMVKLIRDTSKNNNSTVIMVTHDESLINFADKVIKMDSGKIRVID